VTKIQKQHTVFTIFTFFTKTETQPHKTETGWGGHTLAAPIPMGVVADFVWVRPDGFFDGF